MQHHSMCQYGGGKIFRQIVKSAPYAVCGPGFRNLGHRALQSLPEGPGGAGRCDRPGRASAARLCPRFRWRAQPWACQCMGPWKARRAVRPPRPELLFTGSCGLVGRRRRRWAWSLEICFSCHRAGQAVSAGPFSSLVPAWAAAPSVDVAQGRVGPVDGP